MAQLDTGSSAAPVRGKGVDDANRDGSEDEVGNDLAALGDGAAHDRGAAARKREAKHPAPVQILIGGVHRVAEKVLPHNSVCQRFASHTELLCTAARDNRAQGVSGTPSVCACAAHSNWLVLARVLPAPAAAMPLQTSVQTRRLCVQAVIVMQSQCQVTAHVVCRRMHWNVQSLAANSYV